MLWFPRLRELVRQWGLRKTGLDMCRHGSRWKKRTVVISSSSCLSSLSAWCVCEKGSLPLHGRSSNGLLMTSLATPHPWTYAERMARLLVNALVWDRPEIIEEKMVSALVEELEAERPHPRAARGPPVSRAWTRAGRWRLVCRTKWKRKAHINELEGAALLMAVKHLGRSSLRRGQRC